VDPTALPANAPPAAGACEELTAGDFSALVFSTPTALLPPGTGENVRMLLGRAFRLAQAGGAFEKEVIQACAELGTAAGLQGQDVHADPDAGHGAERVCSAAAARVADVFRRAKEARVVLDVAVDTPRCFVEPDAARSCLAKCGAHLNGDPRAHCTGGELVGVCNGRCSGACVLPPGAGVGVCHGACAGKCERDFRGACSGSCTGGCNGVAVRGKPCPGVCTGSCSDGAGACAGKCDGSCTGWWDPPVSPGRCPGVCVGVCAGDLHDTLCSGEYAPQGLDPVCQAACGAEAALALRCDLPFVHAAVRSGKTTPEIERTLAGVQAAVPKIVRLQQGLAKRLPHAIEGATTASVEWSNAFPTAAPHALLCVRAARDAMRETLKWLELTARSTDVILPAIRTDPPPSARTDDP